MERKKEGNNPLCLARFRSAVASASPSEPRQYLRMPSDICHRSCCHNFIVGSYDPLQFGPNTRLRDAGTRFLSSSGLDPWGEQSWPRGNTRCVTKKLLVFAFTFQRGIQTLSGRSWLEHKKSGRQQLSRHPTDSICGHKTPRGIRPSKSRC